jgi:hypothetical protein
MPELLEAAALANDFISAFYTGRARSELYVAVHL